MEVSALLRPRNLTGLVLALGVLAVPALGFPSSRLEWQPEACRLSWHAQCAFTQDHRDAETSVSHRFVTLEARLTAFATADASLYAVFLTDHQDLAVLEGALRNSYAPRPWDPDNLGARTGRLSSEWVALDPNGHFTLRVDEANQSGKSWVAIVNGRGEILGAHPLWSDSGDLASNRPAPAPAPQP